MTQNPAASNSEGRGIFFVLGNALCQQQPDLYRVVKKSVRIGGCDYGKRHGDHLNAGA
jgi:hypothetical protein